MKNIYGVQLLLVLLLRSFISWKLVWPVAHTTPWCHQNY